MLVLRSMKKREEKMDREGERKEDKRGRSKKYSHNKLK